ncbi:uncharacterized protein LOC124926143 [Impatiens glandulifera]|uniref:uncharacterized protein LOC124926143 n=1 Tax=Impatiens glandulifera TaxID=253017 RepID=UPI001FB16F2D|nr:uncharacterized protein LOC124926143 [Impatiens glandulifera]
MPASLHPAPRVDTLKLKLHIERKLGHEKSDKYFQLLNRYLSCKLSKSEFDVLCIGVIGRENILLHNHLIRSILRNAFLAETSPTEARSSVSLNVKLPNGCLRGNLQSLCRDAFPQSPRKGRTPNIRERKFRDRFSPLGPHGKSHVPKFIQQKNANDKYCRSVLIPPIGISTKGKQKKKKNKNKKKLLDSELPDSVSLKARLDKDLEMEGFTISVDSVNLLNRGLDVYLKRLILPSLELARSRMMMSNKPQSENGMMRYLEKRERAIFASLLDFQVALEANPTILGEDWPVQLERICLHSTVSEMEMKFSG